MSGEEDDPVGYDARYALAKQNGVPEIYANGFAVGLSGADGSVILERNGSPVAILNVSYTLAKTLALALGTAVSNFEQNTGQQLLTTHDVDRLFRKKVDEEKDDGAVH